MAAIGTLDWARATDGNLGGRERLALLGPILRTTVAYAVGRVRFALGWRPAARATLDLDTLRWPDSALAHEAEQACRETLGPAAVNHSIRTFVFGLAFAGLDAVRVDPEQLYAAALLHDIAIEAPTPGRCFAVVGAERALAVAARAGAAPETAHAVAEAVAVHPTPGLGFEHGPLGPLVAAGALVDLLGLRRGDLDDALAAQAFAHWPRLGCGRHIGACWRREAAAVPRGRAALIERTAAFSLIMRLAPFPD